MKIKQCSVCMQYVPLWKSNPATCKSCIPKKPIKSATKIGDYTMRKVTVQATKIPKPMKSISDKEKKRQVAYMALKKEHMKRYPLCQANLTGCLNVSTDIHHLFMGADRLKYFLDTSTWKTVCRNCHTRIHSELSNEQLIELGLRLKE